MRGGHEAGCAGLSDFAVFYPGDPGGAPGPGAAGIWRPFRGRDRKGRGASQKGVGDDVMVGAHKRKSHKRYI